MEIKLVNISGFKQYRYSLALAYLKSYAYKSKRIKDNCDIEIINFEIDFPTQRMLDKITIESLAVVGFVCNLSNSRKVFELAGLVKKKCPETLIVFGGPLATVQATKLLEDYEFVDLIVRGEGEETFSRIIVSLLDKTSIRELRGISYRAAGKIIENNDRPVIKNLDEIPSPYLTGVIDPREIKKLGLIEFSRGCYFNCSYCYSGNNHPGVRFFPETRIKSEINWLIKNGIDSIEFLDSTFNIDMRRLSRISKALKDVPGIRNTKIYAEIKAELIDEKASEFLQEASVSSAMIGLQAVDEKTNENIQRYFDINLFKKGIDLLKSRGIEVSIDTICGLPGDNFFRFLRTIKFCLSLYPDYIFTYMLNILPGTKLFEDQEKFSIKSESDKHWLIIENKTFSRAEINKAKIFAESFLSEYYLISSKPLIEGNN